MSPLDNSDSLAIDYVLKLGLIEIMIFNRV